MALIFVSKDIICAVHEDKENILYISKSGFFPQLCAFKISYDCISIVMKTKQHINYMYMYIL